ncbi:hypothetical protein BFL37_13445 [Clavibacter michiganensis]|uniref:Uncharacterized protein n=2 Tax=Clavibacter michiganensis TaxID=28447 RepID=A0A251YHM4_9MICO|nr:hypothetical protein BFL37_13445 [Clavibacter michiganensis]
MNGNTWQPAEEDLHSKLARHISYVFVPVRRDHAVAGWGPGTLMANVIDASVTATRQRDHITPKVKALSERVKQQSLDPLLAELRRATPLTGEFEYALKYAIAPDYSLLLRNLALQVKEGNRVVDLEDSGSGTQSMAVFSLYSYLARISQVAYVLGFEEPEQNLHPQAQSQLIKHLRGTGLQVVFTTHSATMIDALDHEEVVLCRRFASATRAVETEVAQLASDFFVANGLDRDNYYKFHKRRNSEFFFADHVLVTESPIDALVIQTILAQAARPLDDANVSVMPLDGVPNIPYMYHLLQALGIGSTYVVDKDYFLPYVNDKLDQSRDAKGYAVYRKELKSDSLAATLFPEPVDQLRLLDALYADHQEAARMLEAVDFVCFKRSIEMDIVGSLSTRVALCAAIGLGGSPTEYDLLVTNKKAIKQQRALVGAVDGVDARGLPSTLKALRKMLSALTR